MVTADRKPSSVPPGRSSSRVAAVIPLVRALPHASKAANPWALGEQPLGRPRRDENDHAHLRGLAPSGVCHAATVTGRAVGSYPTISPLLRGGACAATERSVFCCTLLEVTLTGRYPAPCSSELGLSSRPTPQSDEGPAIA
jgi:hypothetical protein